MEAGLDVYERPYDPQRPVVGLDETTTQLAAEARTPRPPAPARAGKPGRPARYAYEYERQGVSRLLLLCEPLRGWRHVVVRARRTTRDWAHVVKDLVDGPYPDAETIVLVQDTLTTHPPAARYATFPPAEARRLAATLELHFTPTHGSWLNVADLELAILTKQVLGARIAAAETLTERTTAWHTTRNAARGPVRWRVTTADARSKLARLYPTIHE